MTIICLSDHHTVHFAAKELRRYLRLATGQTLKIVKKETKERAFRLAIGADIGVRCRARNADGDWVVVEPRDDGYQLVGANPRSVLFAVYRYLQAIGFRWIRPGSRGTVIPSLTSVTPLAVSIDEAASYPVRSICIEGTCSIHHVCDLIDWMAKHGMNGYFLQFHLGKQFFQRWYEHEDSPVWQGEPLSDEDTADYCEQFIAELKRRDMLFERVGHGWLCAVLGLPGEGWGAYNGNVSAKQKKWIAEVNGKRELCGGVPLNTNLSYGLPEVRRAVVDEVVTYAANHPEVDVLHFWLADGSNNHCESAESATLRPSDHYVDMLNELDERLNDVGLDTRIVFLIYVDLLWPPTCRRIQNPDRFILMFAPITRSYLQSYADLDDAPSMGPFEYNKLVFPRGAAENVSYLQAWQKQFDGDAFVFDYHGIWACYYDPGMVTLARTLHRDIKALGSIGLNGLNSCQNQRQAFPHTLLMNVMARTLWNRQTSFKAIYTDTFTDAYGRQWQPVAQFFEESSRLWKPFFEPVYLPKIDHQRVGQGKRNIPVLIQLVADLRPIVMAEISSHRGAVRWSWRYLRKHLDLLDHLIPAMDAYLEADFPECKRRFESLMTWLWKNERLLHPALDVHMMVRVFQWRVNEVESYANGRIADPDATLPATLW